MAEAWFFYTFSIDLSGGFVWAADPDLYNARYSLIRISIKTRAQRTLANDRDIYPE